MDELIMIIIYLLLLIGIVFSASTIGIYSIGLLGAVINFIGDQLDEGHIWILGIVEIILILIGLLLLHLVRRINYG